MSTKPSSRQEEEEYEDLQAEYREEGGHYIHDAEVKIWIPPPMKLTERPTRGERLLIDRIVCENFKSYGGMKTMGPFHKSFSAIVGPNGNGKSNIIDAMLFVFGYRAHKIRCKTLSVLIHKSNKVSEIRSCAVQVEFIKIIDNGDDDPNAAINVVPNSRITVCRRAYQNNSSAYWLDGQKVRFADVANQLKKNGIDIVHNRFLILQGEVESIAQMPPMASNAHETGFLEFIDEIIGTKCYEKSLEELKDRIVLIDNQREQKSARVTLAQQHKQNLVEPMKKATAFLRDRNVTIRTSHALDQLKAFNQRKLAEEKSEKLKELDEKRAEMQTRLDEINKFNDERRQEYEEAEKVVKAAEAKYKKIKKVLDDADAKYITLNREIKTSNEERKKKLEEIKKLEAELEKLQGLPERHGAEIEKLEKRKLELAEDIQKEENNTKGDMDKLLKQVDQCVAEKKKADTKFRDLKAIGDEKKAVRDTLQKELDRSKSNEEAERKKLSKLQEELDELQKNVKRKSGEGLNVTPDAIRKKETEAKSNREEAAKLENLEFEKRAIRQKLQSKYAEARDSTDGGMITDKVDKAMFAAKNEGKFQGLYGRLKDLATIDEKYNVGATAATGMSDYWVVDSDQTGAECIQFLKEQRLPAQTFVCVNKMGNLVDACRRPFSTPASSLRIFDLLKITYPEVAPVFYKAFFDTLIAEDIDVASKVAYGGQKRYRVVTFQGELIETTGTLSGGGRRPTQGKFNSGRAKALGARMSKQQIETLKEQCDTAERDLQNVMDQKRVFETSANALENEVEEMKQKIANYQADVEASRRMIPLKLDLINQQEQKVKAATLSPQVVQEKQMKIKEVDAELEKAKDLFNEAEENAKALAQKLKTLQDDKEKDILKKLSKLKEQQKRVEDELEKLNLELRNYEKNKAKTEAKSAKLRGEVENLQESMLAMNAEKKKIEAAAVELKTEEETLKKDKDEKEHVFVAQKNKSSEFDQEEKKLKKQKVTLDNNHQTLQDEIRRILKEEQSLIKGLRKFELSQIPEVEVEPLQMLTEEQLQGTAIKELEAKLHKYTQKMQREEPNLNIIEDYNVACQTMIKRVEELDKVNARGEVVNTGYSTLEAQRMREFMEGYTMISCKVKELFRLISMGGDAELDLVDSTDPFSCRIDFSVRPRGKTWKKIINLSGGEKTLSSLALVFALHHFKPSPFYVMDEIDAALDFQNVSIIANYIKDRTKFTQFIIISLRSNMFELSHEVIAVYKANNVSSSARLGVSSLLHQLLDVHKDKKKQFVLGSNDDDGIVKKEKCNTAICKVKGVGPLSQFLNASLQMSQGTAQSKPPPAVAGPSKPNLDISAIAVDVTGEEIVGEKDKTIETSKDLFVDSFAEEEDEVDKPPPAAASTPFPRNASPQPMDVEEDSDDIMEEIFSSLNSSANDSMEQEQP